MDNFREIQKENLINVLLVDDTAMNSVVLGTILTNMKINFIRLFNIFRKN